MFDAIGASSATGKLAPALQRPLQAAALAILSKLGHPRKDQM
jgi:hypothetical protein